MSKPLKGFITYSHKDAAAKDELRERLAVMEQKNELTTWHDGEITAGDEWYEDISKNLAEADILLYLVSAASLASKNCNKELAEVLESNTKVIPIILEHCDWMNHQLSDFKVLPLKGKPISKWEDPSEGWQNVVDGIRNAIREMQVQAKSSARITPEEIKTLASLAFQRGNFLLMLEEMDMAIAAYSRTIELNPNDAAAYNNRGITYKETGELNRAIEDYNKAIELNPEFAEPYNNHGNVHRERGEHDRAIEDYNKAIKFNPKLAIAYNGRGAAYAKKGDFDNAIEDYTKAIDLKSDYANAYNNRGVAYFKKGEDDLAIKDYTMAIKHQPNHAEAYNGRGAAYAEKGEFNSAIIHFTKAIELDPDCAGAYINRGRIWLYSQRWENFKSDWSAARNLGVDIAIRFRNTYGSVADFEQRKGIRLPPDIAAMLTPNG